MRRRVPEERDSMPTSRNVVPPISIAQGESATVVNNENPQPTTPHVSAAVRIRPSPESPGRAR
jgi:hypothetical protein